MSSEVKEILEATDLQDAEDDNLESTVERLVNAPVSGSCCRTAQCSIDCGLKRNVNSLHLLSVLTVMTLIKLRHKLALVRSCYIKKAKSLLK